MYPAFQANFKLAARRPMPDEAQFLWDSCLEEYKKGVAEKPVSARVMDQIYGKGNWTALPCFCHVQACGKKRRIDDAKAQRANAATRYKERFRLASAFAPAQAARALQQAVLFLGLPRSYALRLRNLESGGEDMPDAFRSIPVRMDHRKHNNVMVRHPQAGYIRFVRVLAALFGQGSAFFNFERWSAFLEAVPRRLLALLWAMYVDDGQLTDAEEAKGAGQALIHTFFEEIGAGLREDKRTWMSRESQFLGIQHDLRSLRNEGYISFWPREGITAELRAMMAQFRGSKKCTPGQAAKFWGLLGFAAQAEYGQLGRTAMRPWKQRQTTDVAPWDLSLTMERSMDFVEVLLNLQPKRHIEVEPDSRRSLVVASDAQVEPGAYPGGGVLAHDVETGARQAGWVVFDDAALASWGLSLAMLREGKQPIALCEAAMVPLALLRWPEYFRGRHIVWFVDNTSAMHSFVKGASRDAHLERIVNVAWMAAFKLGASIWFEWVDSESNWADDLSRSLAHCTFTRELGFQAEQMDCDVAQWQADWTAVWHALDRLTEEQALA